MAGLPLIGVVLLVLLQIFVTLQQRAEAEADARVLVRAAVVCPRVPMPDLSSVDPAAGTGGGTAILESRRGNLMAVRVELPLRSVAAGIDPSAWGVPRPVSTVTMRSEPC